MTLMKFDRLAEPGLVGAIAAFLASDAVGAITGCTVYVDAGYQIAN